MLFSVRLRSWNINEVESFSLVYSTCHKQDAAPHSATAAPPTAPKTMPAITPPIVPVYITVQKR
jgi:hypothetical protein